MLDMQEQDYTNLKRQEDIFLCQVRDLSRIESFFIRFFILKIINVRHITIMASVNFKTIVFKETDDRIT